MASKNGSTIPDSVISRVTEDPILETPLTDDELDEVVGTSRVIRQQAREQTMTRWLRVVVVGRQRGCGTTAMSRYALAALAASSFEISKVAAPKHDNPFNAAMDRAYIVDLQKPENASAGYTPADNYDNHLYALPPKCFLKSMASARKLLGIKAKGISDESVRSCLAVEGSHMGYFPLLSTHPGEVTQQMVASGGARDRQWYLDRRLGYEPFLYVHKPNASGPQYGKAAGAVLCTVPRFRNWYTELFISYEQGGAINQATLIRMLQGAGKHVGVGSNRTHGYGRFDVDLSSVAEMPEGWFPEPIELMPAETHNIHLDLDDLFELSRNAPAKAKKAAKPKKGKKDEAETPAAE